MPACTTNRTLPTSIPKPNAFVATISSPDPIQLFNRLAFPSVVSTLLRYTSHDNILPNRSTRSIRPPYTIAFLFPSSPPTCPCLLVHCLTISHTRLSSSSSLFPLPAIASTLYSMFNHDDRDRNKPTRRLSNPNTP